MSMAFKGNPRLYLKASIVISLYITLSIYLTFSGIKFFLHDATWVFGWKPIAVAVAFAVFFIRFAYRWMMRLDAQYGSGSGWRLVSARVKLPELKNH